MSTPRVVTGEDALKLFGMANLLVENALDRVEREHGLDLGRKPPSAPEKDEVYYPQFDQKIRNEALRMAEHYEIFYCLEKTIRGLVSETLEATEGANWWDSQRVPQILRVEVPKRIQREVDSAVTLRSSAPLDFTNFGELGEIIKANWDLFGSIFNSQKAVEKVMANLNALRAPIAHCTELAEDEVLRLQLSVRDWFRLME